MRPFIILSFLLALPLFVPAQGNNPFLARFSRFKTVYHEEGFVTNEFPVSEVSSIPISGDSEYLHCRYEGEHGNPNAFQLMSTYFQKIRVFRPKTLVRSNSYATFQVDVNSQAYFIAMQVYNGGRDYALSVTKQESNGAVSAEQLLATLNSRGHIALHIQFETGSSELNQSSLLSVNEIVKLMTLSESLGLSIEGHTDNVGTAALNKSLSEARAKSVMNALVSRGVDPKRLRAVGWGQEKPVADNDSEKGRFSNRRVELVKL